MNRRCLQQAFSCECAILAKHACHRSSYLWLAADAFVGLDTLPHGTLGSFAMKVGFGRLGPTQGGGSTSGIFKCVQHSRCSITSSATHCCQPVLPHPCLALPLPGARCGPNHAVAAPCLLGAVVVTAEVTMWGLSRTIAG